MLYNINSEKYQAQVETWDEIVVKATPSMRWAIGKSITYMLAWWHEHQMAWAVNKGKRSPQLTSIPLSEMSNEELAQRTGP